MATQNTQNMFRSLTQLNITGVPMETIVYAPALSECLAKRETEVSTIESIMLSTLADRLGTDADDVRAMLPDDWRLEPGVHLIAGARATGKSRFVNRVVALTNKEQTLAQKALRLQIGERFFSTFPLTDQAWTEFLDNMRFVTWANMKNSDVLNIKYPSKVQGELETIENHRAAVLRSSSIDGLQDRYTEDPGLIIIDSMTLLPFQASVARSGALSGALPSGLYAALARLQAIAFTRRRVVLVVWNPLGFNNNSQLDVVDLESVVTSVLVLKAQEQTARGSATRGFRWAGAYITTDTDELTGQQFAVEGRWDVSESSVVAENDHRYDRGDVL